MCVTEKDREREKKKERDVVHDQTFFLVDVFCVFIGFTQEPNADVLIENKTVYCTSQALSRWKGTAPLSIWYLSMEGGPSPYPPVSYATGK